MQRIAGRLPSARCLAEETRPPQFLADTLRHIITAPAALLSAFRRLSARTARPKKRSIVPTALFAAARPDRAPAAMVSHPEPAGSLSARRAPSIASSQVSVSTVRRHHRQSRSHIGNSSSYNPTNEFPCFTHTGDVEIIVTSAPGTPPKQQRYLLHRLILAQCSGFFEAGTSEEWPRGQVDGQPNMQLARIPSIPTTAELTSQHKRRWRYELDWTAQDTVEGEAPMLVQKDPSESIFGGPPSVTPPRPPPARNKPIPPASGFFRSMANFSTLAIPQQTPQEPVDDLLRDYDNLFRIFYNYPPALDPINIANAYVECKSLLQLADMYDALEVVGPRVDHHLLRFQSRLWKQIAKYPPSYLKLGYLARSRVIFTEALIHVVGQWPQGANQLRGHVPPNVIDLIEDKVDELEELKQKAEAKLFRLTLTTSRGDRVTPVNGWLEWMAMSLFRQWMAESTTPPPAPILKTPTSIRMAAGAHARTGSSQSGQPQPSTLPTPPVVNTGRVFRMVGAGGNAYLNHEEIKRFLKINPEFYTRDNLKRFERRIDELKNLAKDVVKPLTRNFLELDLGRDGGGLPYLTCTRLEERDFPWED